MAAAIDIHKVRPEELDEAGRVTAAAYEEHVPGDGSWGTYLDDIADVRRRAEHAMVLVATSEGRLAGSATLELDTRIPSSRQPPLTSDEAHLRMVGVDPEMRRLGVGRRLVEAAVEIARQHGKSRLTLDTTEQMRAARTLYESMGFRFAGTSDRVPDVCMLMYELRLA